MTCPNFAKWQSAYASVHGLQNALQTHPRSVTVTGLKLEDRKGQSAGLLVQNQVFCLGTRDSGCHLEAARLQALWAGTWKIPRASRTVKCLTLQEGALQPGALSTLANTQAPRAFWNSIRTKQFSTLAVPRYHPHCETAIKLQILKHSYLQPPIGSSGSHPVRTHSFLKAPRGWLCFVWIFVEGLFSKKISDQLSEITAKVPQDKLTGVSTFKYLMGQVG